ncbi:MAG: hypothetical protein M3Y83_14140, partial [Actinomycetota bacterium]|nr:hypothetical protein [Actinomycetota bacterium]
TSTAFEFWRDFNTHSSAIVRVFAHLGSVVAWEDAWDGVRGLATMIDLDTSEWPEDLTPGGLIGSFTTLAVAGNALFKDLGNKAKWTVAWNAFTAFVDKLLGAGTITWPVLEPGGWFVDALEFVQSLIGETGREDIWPKGAGGVTGQVPSGLHYTAQLDLGGSLPSGNLYYCVTAVVDGVETPPSAEVLYFGAGLGTVGMKIKLDWNAFTGATQYRVYRRVRSMAGDIESRRIATVVATTFTDQTARSGGTAASPPLSVDLAAQAAAEAAAEAAAAANDALVTGADPSVPKAPTWGFLQGVMALGATAANSVPYPGFLELPIFYHYTVTAVSADGRESVASAEKFVMIMSPAQVKVTWTASTTPGTTHRVYRRSSKTGETLRLATGLTGTTFTDGAGSATTVAQPGTTTAVAGSAVAGANTKASSIAENLYGGQTVLPKIQADAVPTLPQSHIAELEPTIESLHVGQGISVGRTSTTGVSPSGSGARRVGFGWGFFSAPHWKSAGMEAVSVSGAYGIRCSEPGLYICELSLNLTTNWLGVAVGNDSLRGGICMLVADSAGGGQYVVPGAVGSAGTFQPIFILQNSIHVYLPEPDQIIVPALLIQSGSVTVYGDATGWATHFTVTRAGGPSPVGA